MKGTTVARVILEKLQELGEGTLDAFFPKNYAYTALWRPLLGLDKPSWVSFCCVHSSKEFLDL